MSRVLMAALDAVPQWELAIGARVPKFQLSGPSSVLDVHASRQPEKRLETFRHLVEQRTAGLEAQSEPLPASLSTQFVQHRLVVAWLADQAPHVQWEDLLAYIEDLGERTYENDPVGCNIVVAPPEAVSVANASVIAPQHQKVLDPLAASPFSYLRVTGSLQLVAYEQIDWDDVYDETQSELYPGFLRPIALALEPSEFAVIRTGRGDIVVLDEYGLIATKRKGRWRIYEPAEFQQTLFEIIGGPYALAQNLFEITFDLSFRRHGALLIYDPERKVVDELANTGECCLLPDHTGGDACRKMLSPMLQPIALGGSVAKERKRRILAEVASMDGAIIFSDDNILAVGAMINPHQQATTEKGARGTAAVSAFHHGGIPIKVSSDGDVTVLYGQRNLPPNRLVFM